MYDLVIKNGTIADGSGGAGYKANIAVEGGKTATIENGILEASESTEVNNIITGVKAGKVIRQGGCI